MVVSMSVDESCSAHDLPWFLVGLSGPSWQLAGDGEFTRNSRETHMTYNNVSTSLPMCHRSVIIVSGVLGWCFGSWAKLYGKSGFCYRVFFPKYHSVAPNNPDVMMSCGQQCRHILAHCMVLPFFGVTSPPQPADRQEGGGACQRGTPASTRGLATLILGLEAIQNRTLVYHGMCPVILSHKKPCSGRKKRHVPQRITSGGGGRRPSLLG